MSERLPDRRVRFHWPDDLEPVWSPRVPELAIAANAVSLLMPHAEPYVVASVRAAVDDLGRGGPGTFDPDLAADAHAYAEQEAQHHGQHRRFNKMLLARYPSLAPIDRILGGVFRRLRRRSSRFGLAFATGFETIVFVSARWVNEHQNLLRDADPTATTLFLWHLAEEVEHKEVAFDLYEASGGGRVRLAFATAMAALVLAFGSWAATLTMLRAEGRLFSPISHVRLMGWSISFVFAALPVVVVSLLPGHHPRDLVDPPGLTQWLDHLDPATGTVPEYALP